MNITIEDVENAIEEYMEHVTDMAGEVPESYQDLLTFVADTLNVNQEELEAEYSDILNAAIHDDEDAYILAGDNHRMNSNERKTELQDSFMKFYKKKCVNEVYNEILFDKMMHDNVLKKLRQTARYVNGDAQDKYQILWRYCVNEFAAFCSDEATLRDTCEMVAAKDENTL